jgi:hypothetical protein
MKIIVEEWSEETSEKRDYRNYICFMDEQGKKLASFCDGEPEDANLAKDFSEVYNIQSMLIAAHTAGLKGEPLEFESRIV